MVAAVVRINLFPQAATTAIADAVHVKRVTVDARIHLVVAGLALVHLGEPHVATTKVVVLNVTAQMSVEVVPRVVVELSVVRSNPKII